MKTKLICLLIALIMCLSCLAGCLGGDDDTGDGDDGTGSGTGDGGKVDVGGGDGTGEWWESIDYSQTSLTFQMTHCSNNQELPSGCQSYLAGETYANGTIKTDIDDLIDERNSNAYKNTKTSVTYRYYDDVASTYGFARAMDAIDTDIKNGKASAPDMYCNFMTDMLICSLKGCFANVYNTEYFNPKDDGYMADLMGSLTLNTSKIYILASDYFLDLIRAFFVVPVNANLFNSIASEMIESDLNGDGVIDIEDFFEEVKPCDCRKCSVDDEGALTESTCVGNWTYDRLIEYAEAIYTPGTESASVEGKDITDTLGFALGFNGLPAAGMIYTSSVTIIEKEQNDDGTYNYYYPETNQKLFDIVTAIDEMMDKDGIMMATQADAGIVGLSGVEQTALLGIRRQFTTNKMLFGGIILVGSLEYPVYQQMKDDENGGFGVVPVPVYQQGDAYLTQIHVVGRAGAINYFSTKVEQCSAFLQYQSENSTEILNDYYDYNLVAGTASGVKGNVEMLEYIRQNVRTSFDKLYEDAIGYMYPNTGLTEDDRYHALLMHANFEYSDTVASDYEEKYSTKSNNLELLEIEYTKLP